MAARASITPAVSAAVSPAGATSVTKGTNLPAASASTTTTSAAPAATTPGASGATQNAGNAQDGTANQAEAAPSSASRASSSPSSSPAPATTASFAWVMAQADTAAVAPDASASTSGDSRDVGASKPRARDEADVDAPTADASSGALAALSLLLGDAMRGTTMPADGGASNSTTEDPTTASPGIAASTQTAPAPSASPLTDATPPTGATLPTGAGAASAAIDSSNNDPSGTQSVPLQPAMGAEAAGAAAIKLAANSTALGAPKSGASGEAAAGDGTSTAAASPTFAAPPSATASPTQLVRLVPVPVSDRAWPQAVAAQVHWLASNGVQSATLKLSPEHLGPVEIHIELQSSQVNVTFSAAHAETRGALEQTVPRLRELLAGNGLTLGHTHVQQEARSGRPPPDRRSTAGAESDEPVSVPIGGTLGLIDEYA